MRETIHNWLKSDNHVLKLTVDKATGFFFKAARNDRFDIIFYQGDNKDGILQMVDLIYAGIYDKVNDQIFDAHDMLKSIAISWGYDESTSYYKTAQGFGKAVRERINGIIGNDRKNLSITNESQVHDYSNIRNLSAREYTAPENARKLFLEGKTPDDIFFDSYYGVDSDNIKCFSKKDYLDYIADKDGTIDRFARQWISENQERILVEFLINDHVKGCLRGIIEDTGNSLHYMKMIIDAVKSTDCKTVNVTTLIGGQKLTFKTEAADLKRDCGTHYSTYYLPAQDRRVFEETYGRHANYGPLDITQISYSRKILYDRDAFEQSLTHGEQEESQTFSQGMGGMA